MFGEFNINHPEKTETEVFIGNFNDYSKLPYNTKRRGEQAYEDYGNGVLTKHQLYLKPIFVQESELGELRSNEYRSFIPLEIGNTVKITKEILGLAINTEVTITAINGVNLMVTHPTIVNEISELIPFPVFLHEYEI